ncbi:phosphotransferase [bacterium]
MINTEQKGYFDFSNVEGIVDNNEYKITDVNEICSYSKKGEEFKNSQFTVCEYKILSLSENSQKSKSFTENKNKKQNKTFFFKKLIMKKHKRSIFNLMDVLMKWVEKDNFKKRTKILQQIEISMQKVNVRSVASTKNILKHMVEKKYRDRVLYVMCMWLERLKEDESDKYVIENYKRKIKDLAERLSLSIDFVSGENILNSINCDENLRKQLKIEISENINISVVGLGWLKTVYRLQIGSGEKKRVIGVRVSNFERDNDELKKEHDTLKRFRTEDFFPNVFADKKINGHYVSYGHYVSFGEFCDSDNFRDLEKHKESVLYLIGKIFAKTVYPYYSEIKGTALEDIHKGNFLAYISSFVLNIKCIDIGWIQQNSFSELIKNIKERKWLENVDLTSLFQGFLENIKNISFYLDMLSNNKYSAERDAIENAAFPINIMKQYFTEKGYVQQISILGGGTDPIKPIKVRTDKGVFVLKCLGDNEKRIKYMIALNNHLYKKGIPMANFFPKKQKDASSSEEYLIEYDGKYYALMEFMETGEFLEKDCKEAWTNEHHKIIGYMAAEIYKAAEDFVDEPFEYKDRDKIIEAYKTIKISKDTHKFLMSWFKTNSKLIKTQRALFLKNFGIIKNSLKKGNIHNDLNPRNIKFDEQGKIIGIIELGHAQYDHRIVELLKPMLGVPNGMFYVYSKDKLLSLLKGYKSSDSQFDEKEIKGVIEIIRSLFVELSMIYINPKRKRDNMKINPELKTRVEGLLKSFEQFANDFSEESKINHFVESVLSVQSLPNTGIWQGLGKLLGLQKFNIIIRKWMIDHNLKINPIIFDALCQAV